jgi:hypothetical protein
MALSHGLKRTMVALALLVGGPEQTEAYEVETHSEISAAALQQPTVVDALRQALGIESLAKTFRSRTVQQLLEEGAQREDDWGQFVFHFHNPLSEWNGSGLFGVFTPSVLWVQDPGNPWPFDRVRVARTNALAGPTRAERDDAFVSLFRGLGQLIHLIQDAASPAHTRNDPHYAGFNYETLVRALHTRSPARDVSLFRSLLSAPIKPDVGWRSLPPNPLELPSNTVARLIDTELYVPASYYVGTNPDVTMDPRIGLAEYTNANFLSEDSSWESVWASLPRPFRYPARPATIEAYDICREYTGFCLPDQSVLRLYYVKEPPGDAGYHLATVGFLRDYFVRWNLDPARASQRSGLDETVYRDYARRLVRRAVGYSAAFLEDFLRGEFKVEVVDYYWGSRTSATVRWRGDSSSTTRSPTAPSCTGG